MSAADAVGALPGGAAFVALWDQVEGDPGSIDDLATTLRSTASRADETQRGVATAAGEVGDAWHGAAADAFGGYMSRYAAASSTVHASMTAAAGAVSDAASAVRSAMDQLTAIAGRILDASDRAASLKDDPRTVPLYDAIVEEAVQNGCAEARPAVAALVAALGKAASAVRSSASGAAFLDLKAADDSTYLPAPGKPIEWNPVPAPTLSGTAPASATGGGAGDGYAGPTGGGPASGGPPEAMPTGDVATWIAEAKKILIANGVPAGELSDSDINLIIQHESSGNPHAENLTDSNAAAGHPSKGLMQTIDSTFNSYALPGHTDIWNPVDNIVAGVRYALSRYGSLDNVPGVAAVHSGGSYVGY